MRDVLKGNSRGRNTSSVTVKALPGSKITADPELSKIATTTLTSVKQHMEVAFPILNHAGITVDNLKQAVSLAGGIVQFMKDIAAGKTLGGIDRKKLGELWDQKTGGTVKHREALKDLFRAAMPERHEWIPSNLMLEVIDRDMDAHKIGEIPEWIELQHKFRIKTNQVVFGVDKSIAQSYRGASYAVLQGHVGALSLEQRNASGDVEYVSQHTSQASFHDSLRGAFKAATTKKVVLAEISKVIQTWLWDGTTMPSIPLHPNLRWTSAHIDVSKDPGLSSFKSKSSQVQKQLFDEIKAF
jgi:hypothetical protein